MDTIAKLQSQLERQAEAKAKSWWERYLKHQIAFRGVKMAGIRAALHAWYEAEGIGSRFSLVEQKELSYRLIRQVHAEDKLAGILFLQEILMPQGVVACPADLEALAKLLDEGYIDDWNTCDWLCVKVLGPLAGQQGEACARGIAAWKSAASLWRRRAAGVAFVNLARHGEANFPGFTDMLLDVCAATVQSRERFAQTGTGWVLRELSYAEPERVVAFIGQHEDEFSREGWAYLVQKLPDEVRVQIAPMRTG